MDFKKRFIERAREAKQRIVLPEGEDARTVVAAAEIRKNAIAEPLVLGNPDAVAAVARSAGVNIGDVQIIDTKADRRLDNYAAKIRGACDIHYSDLADIKVEMPEVESYFVIVASVEYSVVCTQYI